VTFDQLPADLVSVTLGFILGQLANAVAFVHRWWVRPRIRISSLGGNHILLDHYPEMPPNEESVREIHFGFRVSNCGRRVASGIRPLLIKVEAQEGDSYRELTAHTYTLSWADPEGRSREPETLIPGASLNVALAEWREDYDFVAPAIGYLEDYYEEACAGVVGYRFSVAVVDEKGRYVTDRLTIAHPYRPTGHLPP
jgi:hypothetical protein